MWEAISSNFMRSRVLIVMMGALLVVLGFVVGGTVEPNQGPLAGAAIAVVLWLILWIVAVFQGDSILLATMGAREIQSEDFPVLWNVVEEMKIAAGLPEMPRVFIIENPSPNAFAVGRKPEVSAVAVTSGLLQRLNRDELQGVIAHEIGHIYNYDIRFMTIASVMMGTIVIIADVFLRGLRHGSARRTSSSKENNQGQIVFLVLAIALAILAPILAQMLYFACSRRREYLADASAARFTRYPEGLASALEKISVYSFGGGEVNRAVAPLYIINPLQAHGGGGILSTHPPTEDRVKILRGMAGGASFVDYDAAYKKIKRGRGVIGTRTLAAADETIGIRAASVEPEVKHDKMQRVREVGDLLGMLGNYLLLSCECGMRMKLPPGDTRNEVLCPRCGRANRVAQAEVALDVAETATGMKPPVLPVGAIPTAPVRPPMRYHRQHAGWETFKCSCGAPIQISPGFSASRIVCRSCGAMVSIDGNG